LKQTLVPERLPLHSRYPFEKNSWDRAARLLGENEGEYWNNTSANTYQTEDDTKSAITLPIGSALETVEANFST
jgi:hypothetical protein